MQSNQPVSSSQPPASSPRERLIAAAAAMREKLAAMTPEERLAHVEREKQTVTLALQAQFFAQANSDDPRYSDLRLPPAPRRYIG